ncbi:hypothetical protein PFNF54_05728 [Plasmodium falciparum NF54]|uniref:Uncharacterized protein n=1 Tax=Plasmodium falciparum (isolate NF54) TaxID=5843 RepID=W7JLI5_PLAFO|nr:hypothetical protein PFNF54_05728 [Plasmodium falciparum NF54]
MIIHTYIYLYIPCYIFISLKNLSYKKQNNGLHLSIVFLYLYKKIKKKKKKKTSFNLLLKKRIKQMNKQTENTQDKEDDRYSFQDEIADFGKSWYEEKLVNDIPRKLTIF